MIFMGEQKVSFINKTNTRNKWLIVVIGIVLILGASYFVFFYSNNAKKHPKNSPKVESTDETSKYLISNYSAINPEKEDDFSDLSILSDDLKDREIFFTGEYHGINANELLNMKFLKYFKEKVDFKYYLCELSYSDAYFLNKFLESGDVKILEDIYKPLKGTFAWNKDSYNHWKKLYEFNKTLPEARRITVVGIDIEHQPQNALLYMTSVLPKKEVPNKIKDNIEELKTLFLNISNQSGDKLTKLSEKLRKDMEAQSEVYKEYLGQDYFGFKLVNENILYTKEVYSAKEVDFNKVRDKRIYENFEKVYDNLPKGKYYGQWGVNHIFQRQQGDIKWVGVAMNEKGSRLENKILSIVYMYEDCKQMSKTGNNKYNIQDFNSNNSLIFSSFTEKNYTLFKLNGENSPFRKELIWLTPDDNPIDGVTTDYYQYVVVIKDSQATEPLNDEY